MLPLICPASFVCSFLLWGMQCEEEKFFLFLQKSEFNVIKPLTKTHWGLIKQKRRITNQKSYLYCVFCFQRGRQQCIGHLYFGNQSHGWPIIMALKWNFLFDFVFAFVFLLFLCLRLVKINYYYMISHYEWLCKL